VNKNELYVIVIEDDLVQAENLRENLQELGYISGVVALTFIKVKSLDLYLFLTFNPF
jgi:hypothetical protein